MIRGMGIDIIEVKRIRKIMEDYGDRFLKRILTENEINYCMKFSKPELHLAGRFAAKEAYSKAIGTGVGKSYSWKDIEILNNEKGKPYIVHIKESEYSVFKFEVSISHTEEYACAAVSCEETA
ncbi:MAG TPA: holo-ACP synthase [Ignavibacteria bacterium]|nr:holo-[acyl-carrier-protein] synthase [Bacteroidota bacterium]HRI86086.1 holo-ACP synthase [Ignavibacteria bacterium]HRK00649.1 holo-ACP synthase [Ignavibacteria bacterium]